MSLEKPKRRRTPQDKKRTSLEKDRVYFHGLNSKQRRKSMPDFNKTETRAKRSADKNRMRKQIIDGVDVVGDLGADTRRSWKPTPVRLGQSLTVKAEKREAKRARKLRRQQAKAGGRT